MPQPFRCRKTICLEVVAGPKTPQRFFQCTLGCLGFQELVNFLRNRMVPVRSLVIHKLFNHLGIKVNFGAAQPTGLAAAPGFKSRCIGFEMAFSRAPNDSRGRTHCRVSWQSTLPDELTIISAKARIPLTELVSRK